MEPGRRVTATRVLLALAILIPISILFLWWAGTISDDVVPEVGREVFGNIPQALEALFYAGVTAFLGIAAYLFALRAKNWERGTRERRAGMWGRRLKALAAGLSMRTLLEDRASGLMHAMVYFGFLVLFAGTVTLEIDKLLPTNLRFLEGRVYQGYSATLDFFALVYLGGLAWAALLRYGVRPWRIRSKTRPEDGWILLTLVVIGITGLAVEAARITVDGRPSFETWSFVGYPLSYLVPSAASAGTHQVLWVLHALSFLAFLVVLPTTKLRHMLTSPANMMLSPRERPKGAMRPVPNLMEATDISSIGAAAVGDFTWKQLLDTDACTICGRCTSVCPANLTGKALDPREIVLKLGEVAALSGEPVVSPPVGIDAEVAVSADSVFERITAEELWACTSCKACDDICPVEIEILDKILDMRRYLTLMEAEFPAELGGTFISLENSSNVYGMSQQDRAGWTEELDFPVKVLGNGVTAEYLYWVGCLGSFDDRNRRVTLDVAGLLNEAGVDFGILGTRELCTGDPARRSGNEYVYQQLALRNMKTLNELGVSKVITQCPHCFNTLANEYPQLGGDYEVVHHSQLLEGLVAAGRIQPRGESQARITYHDPCFLGRHNDIYSEPRGVLRTVTDDLVEMPRCGSRALCCGAGGARMWMEERVGKRVNIERTEEAIATGASQIATACPFCYIMLDDGLRELGRDKDVRVRDISS
ncbi:MAG: heterodisulfide reductase-related iron-sulfur binding cluster, partial [Acidimicrobiia bacterium]